MAWVVETAMIIPYAQVACQSVHRLLGQFDKLGFPVGNSINKKRGFVTPFLLSVIAYAPWLPKMPRGSETPKE